jgi:hypothetical protein
MASIDDNNAAKEGQIKQAMDIRDEMDVLSYGLQKHLTRIDKVLANFSETATLLRPARTGLWKSATPPSLDQIVDVYAPVGMKESFRQLYRLLRTHLLQEKRNAAAFLRGNRGSGKSLVLRQCLRALQDESEHIDGSTPQKPMLRIISVNGIAVPGRNFSAVIMEILFQLTASDMDDGAIDKKEQKILELIRLKKTSSFTNNIQLLSEALEIARGDQIPFLFVLDPLEAFIATGGHSPLQQPLDQRNKQNQELLLYYILDRVATRGSLISFVGLSHDVHCLKRLEKRTRSRAESALFISCESFPSYEELIEAMLVNLEECPELQQQMGRCLRFSDNMTTEHESVVKCLQREHRMGRDARWFSRVLSFALIHYRAHCSHFLDCSKVGGTPIMDFSLKFLVEAMLDMGASLPQHRPSDLRMEALTDLSSPQTVLILAAKRILTRDTQRKSDTPAIRLTLERILNEYNTAIQKGSLLSNRYSSSQLWKAFQELVGMGLFRPAADTGGKLPFQYMHLDSMYQDMDRNTFVTRMPLHMTVDVHREVKVALEQNIIQCSTALREWGLKTN